MEAFKTAKNSFYGDIAKLTFPIVLQNLLSSAVSSADVVMLNFVGQAHISAVSLAAQYANVLFMVFYGLGTGASMLSSQYYGKGDLRAIHAFSPPRCSSCRLCGSISCSARMNLSSGPG